MRVRHDWPVWGNLLPGQLPCSSVFGCWSAAITSGMGMFSFHFHKRKHPWKLTWEPKNIQKVKEFGSWFSSSKGVNFWGSHVNFRGSTYCLTWFLNFSPSFEVNKYSNDLDWFARVPLELQKKMLQMFINKSEKGCSCCGWKCLHFTYFDKYPNKTFYLIWCMLSLFYISTFFMFQFP